MSKAQAIAEIASLVAYKWPGHLIVLWDWHSEECVTIVAVRPDHHAVRLRMNLGASLRWTMNQLSEAKLTVG